MREPTDGQLVAKAADGEYSAFDELVSRHRTRVYYLALSKIRGRDNALDIAQEAFVQAYMSLKSLREPEKFGLWLSSITANLCKMHLRKTSEVLIPFEMIEELHAPVESDPNADIAREALDLLPNGTRSAAILYFIEEMKQTEIAEFLGISLAAVKSRIRDARASLQKEMIYMVKQTAKNEVAKVNETAPVIRIAYAIIMQAILDGADRIELEPAESRVSVSTNNEGMEREIVQAIKACEETEAHATLGKPGLQVSLKVGEDWRELMTLPDYIREPITQRFKLMADVDLACTDKSQEGRIRIRYADNDYVLLVTITPTPMGEKVAVQFAA